MKSTFSDPIATKDGKKIKSPFNFDAPCYDERTSCYVNAGTHYGTGHTQPVGHSGVTKQKVPALPFGHKKGMKDEDRSNKNLKIELEI